jgi:hypothetical protein
VKIITKTYHKSKTGWFLGKPQGLDLSETGEKVLNLLLSSVLVEITNVNAAAFL